MSYKRQRETVKQKVINYHLAHPEMTQQQLADHFMTAQPNISFYLLDINNKKRSDKKDD